MYPIIEYSHIINKNTAEFTLKDFAGFMKWWMKQPGKTIMEGTPQQQETYYKDVAAMKQWRKEEAMSKNNKYKDAMNSRLPNEFKPIDIGELVSDLEISEKEQEIVADMTLTQQDVDALAWGLGQLLDMFDYSEMPEVGNSLLRLETDLEPLATKGE